MLEGHVLRELLAPEIKSAPFFEFHELFHGVTAPGFLFSAGFTFAIATQRKWGEVVRFSYGFFRRVWRAVTLILLGYALHLPYFSLRKIYSDASAAQWNAFLIFDVLQCIGFGLLTIRLILIVLRKENLFIGTLIFLLLAIVYSTPFLWTAQLSDTLPGVLVLAVNGLQGSIFPLFPFAGFFLAGTCISWLFLRAVQYKREKVFIKTLMAAALVLIVAGITLDKLPFRTYTGYSFWTTSPNYFWIRLGILFLMLGGLWHLEEYFAAHGRLAAWMPKWLVVLGIESLFVYILHLIVLCGWVINTEFNLRFLWGGKLNLIEAVLVFAGLTLAMIFASAVWRYMKKFHKVLMTGIFWWIGFCLVWSLFMNPY
jgi:acyltransferase